MGKNDELEKDKKVIRAIQRDISVVTAALLLTGQITIKGVFVTPGGFRLSIAGPLTGSPRLEGKSSSKTATVIIDIIDVFIAILLINRQLVVEGTFIGSNEFTLIVSGPIFGMPFPEPSLPDLKRDYNFYKKVVSKQFNVHQELVNKLIKE
jgi:hypothetical protein